MLNETEDLIFVEEKCLKLKRRTSLTRINLQHSLVIPSFYSNFVIGSKHLCKLARNYICVCAAFFSLNGAIIYYICHNLIFNSKRWTLFAFARFYILWWINTWFIGLFTNIAMFLSHTNSFHSKSNWFSIPSSIWSNRCHAENYWFSFQSVCAKYYLFSHSFFLSFFL